MKSRDISSEHLRWVTQTCTFNFHHRVRGKNEWVIILCHSMGSVPHVFITQPSLTSDFSPNGSAAACFHGYRRRVWKDVQEWLSSWCLKSSDVIADIVQPVYHFICVSLPPAARHHIGTFPFVILHSLRLPVEFACQTTQYAVVCVHVSQEWSWSVNNLNVITVYIVIISQPVAISCSKHKFQDKMLALTWTGAEIPW